MQLRGSSARRMPTTLCHRCAAPEEQMNPKAIDDMSINLSTDGFRMNGTERDSMMDTGIFAKERGARNTPTVHTLSYSGQRTPTTQPTETFQKDPHTATPLVLPFVSDCPWQIRKSTPHRTASDRPDAPEWTGRHSAPEPAPQKTRHRRHPNTVSQTTFDLVTRRN